MATLHSSFSFPSFSLSLKKLINPSPKPTSASFSSFLIYSANLNRLPAMNSGSVPQQPVRSASSTVYKVPDMETDQMDRVAEQAFQRYSSSSANRSGNGVAIVWFRNDLRVLDNEVLYKAWISSQAVLPVYCIDPRLFGTTYYFGFPKTGALRAQFLMECLADLKKNLMKNGLNLLIQHGKPEEILPSLAKTFGAHTVYAQKETCSEELNVERLVRKSLKQVVLQSSPEQPNRNLQAVEAKSTIRGCVRIPKSLGPPPSIDDWGSIPSVDQFGLHLQNVSKGMKFIGGESAALSRVHEYFWKKDLLKIYKDTRNGMLGPDYSTKFSTWLGSGSLSPRFIHEEVKRYESERLANNSTYWVLFELIWRDYFRFLSIKYGNSLFHLGGPRKVELRWSQDKNLFESWRDGHTGYPLIDANMIELSTTGFMSNRGRQIVCSFLVRDMGIDWRMGAEWFETCLLDYDPCSNYGNWTYGAGVGNDPREDRYFSNPKQLAIACGESSPSHLVLLGFVNRTLDSIKRNIAQIFANVFCSQTNNAVDARTCGNADLLPFKLEDFMTKFGEKYQLSAEDWFSENKNLNDKQDPHAVFNVLDVMLKDNLERLKMMRESISLANMNCQGWTFEANYLETAEIIKDLCLYGKLGTALWLRRKLMQKGVVFDVFTHNYLINGLCKTGDLDKADELIKEMSEQGPSPNCATYNTFINGYCLINNVDKVLDLFSTMANKGIKPNRVTCNILVHALCKKGHLEDAKKHLEEILDDDNDKTASDKIISSTILMDGYFKNGKMVQAKSVWDNVVQMDTQVDVVAYNVLINGFCSSQEIHLAFGYFCEMIKRGLLPDVFTYNTLISGLCKIGKFDEASYIHGIMSKIGIIPDQMSYKSLIQGLCINGVVVRANELLLGMLEKSMVPEPLIWNLIIDCYGRCGNLGKAFSTKNQMLIYGVKPNVYTYNALIYAQVKEGNITNAVSLKQEMHSYGLLPDVVTYNLLIGAACNSQNIEWALHLLDEMLMLGCEPDIITYTELIRGHCIKDNMKEAEELLRKMHNSGMPIDDVPYKILVKKYCKMRKPDKVFDLYYKWMERKRA
ncbi:pentatricopeptide repeat-containing protein At5g24830 isoform X2 [Ziziphus jujuba]|uniref:Pentatricopeptide repeat-containing protein At5g24830 isoform X2 n=1 Tax=Ziziphus jujuba TaxID=326968 RepID=A0A6P6GA56_ZIZJJ|nr:pentatricopeptide repeat-containing protein At5g24830 isoform X2 [Ziziphus jujuba]